MSDILRLVYGSTTVDLHDSTIHTIRYAPSAPDISAEEIARIIDGGKIAKLKRMNVSERGEFIISGANAAAFQTSLQGVQKALSEAMEHQDVRGYQGVPTYVKYQPDGFAALYRSPLHWGKDDAGDEILASAWGAYCRKVNLSWRRAYYWEADSETELPLTNAHGSGTGGRTVYNHDDSAHDNYVKIADTDVAGVLPSPIVLQLTNSYNNAAHAYDIWVGQYICRDTSTSPPSLILEGESATGGSAIADASCSNGYYNQVSVGESEAKLLYWSITNTLLRTDKRRHFLVLARFFDDPSDFKLRLKTSFPSGATADVITQTNLVTCGSDRLQALGALQLPPWLSGYSSTKASMNLELYGLKSGTGTLKLDFLYLLPIDHWRIYRPSTRGLLYTDILKDDPPGEQLYVSHQSGISGASGIYTPLGEPLYAWPGRDQALFFLALNDSGASEIDRSFTVRAWHRPRRLSF